MIHGYLHAVIAENTQVIAGGVDRQNAVLAEFLAEMCSLWQSVDQLSSAGSSCGTISQAASSTHNEVEEETGEWSMPRYDAGVAGYSMADNASATRDVMRGGEEEEKD